MQYRKYGTEGPEVSVLGFGAMRLPRDWNNVDMPKAAALIRKAFRGGVNFVDSHHNYHNGNSEVAIGQALAGWKGHRVYVQTKTPFYRQEPLDFFKKLIEEAVAKLGVQRIDYLLFHSMDMKMFKARGKGFFRLTDWAMKRGLVHRRGFSSHDEPANVKAFIDTGEFSAMLLSYNWLNPKMAESLAYGAEKGLGVSVMNPVGGGSLAATTPKILGMLPGAASAPEVAVRYVLSTPGVAVALSGMSTPAQVAENLHIAGRRGEFMTARQRKAMLAKTAKVRQQFMAVCTSCGYCMPCPHGVNIPQNFLLWNQARYLGLARWARKRYQAMHENKKGDHSAAACKQCGACLPKCPNKIPIMEQLAQTRELLGGRKK